MIMRPTSLRKKLSNPEEDFLVEKTGDGLGQFA